jgi:hypothetical protein
LGADPAADGLHLRHLERLWRSPFLLGSGGYLSVVGTSRTLIPRREELERLDIFRVRRLRPAEGSESFTQTAAYPDRPFLMSRAFVPDVPPALFLKSRGNVPNIPTGCG